MGEVYYCGCDIGSTYSKAIILDADGKIVGQSLIRTGIDPEQTSKVMSVYAGKDDAGYFLAHWGVNSVEAPTEDTLPTVEESRLIVRDAQEEAAVAAELAHQAAKPAARKAKENELFAFIRLVLAAAGDSRADDVPTPKLGFEELTPMIEGIQASDPMTAVNLTLKGLSIDSALKRYDAMWWDDAAEHEAQ